MYYKADVLNSDHSDESRTCKSKEPVVQITYEPRDPRKAVLSMEKPKTTEDVASGLEVTIPGRACRVWFLPAACLFFKIINRP